MSAKCWITGAPDVDGRVVERLAREVGLERGERAGEPGVLVVADASERACAEVARAAAESGAPVLAVVRPGGRLGDGAWALLEAGAEDALAWDEVAEPARVVRARLRRWVLLSEALERVGPEQCLVGRSAVWRAFLRRVAESALFSTAPVLIVGETGTGKDQAAKLIHHLRPPPKKDLIVVDCTTISPDLAGSELFGHERGAFTGAERAREGAVALADGGTLFLDEVGELPPDLQAQLLRAVQEKMYKRVGGDVWRRADFRLVCATNRDLEAEVAAGRFRRDLYFRIAGDVCRAPPLRERTEDILPLAEHFLRGVIGESAEVPRSVRALLQTREYPGNVRDLKRLVEVIGRRCAGAGVVTPGAVPEEERPRRRMAGAGAGAAREAGGNGTEMGVVGRSAEALEKAVRAALAGGMSMKEISRAAEEIAISAALEECGLPRLAAERLGISERTVQLRLRGRDAGLENGSNGSVNGSHRDAGGGDNGRRTRRRGET